MSESTVLRDILQGMLELRSPRDLRSKCGEIFVRSAEVIFEKTVPELYIRRITVCIGADVPREGVVWILILKIPAGSRAKETCIGYLPCDLPIELPPRVAKGNHLMPNRILREFLAIHDFPQRLVRREVMQAHMMQGVAADFKLLVNFSNLSGAHDLALFVRPWYVERRLQPIFTQQIDCSE